MVKQSYKDKQVVLKEGSYGEGTYLILQGKVRIIKTIQGELVEIATLDKGDYFGEMSFLDRQPRSASAVADGDVILGIIDKDFLEEEISKTSEEFRLLLYTLVERLRQTTSALVGLRAENHILKK
ncbi:MAG: cyclic nucleotide-binding domain-containing protein [Nitrospirae bacterium]|nr:cyclic nucleotide-binding domain-containing protein [Nitrospirota bacterium]